MSEMAHATWFDVIAYVVGSFTIMAVGGAVFCALLMVALRERP